MTIDTRAKKIKTLALDVDGVLTSGIIYYGSQEIELKGFFIHDGLGIKLLQKSGVQVAIISAKKSIAVERRLKDLDVSLVYLGYNEKLPAYNDLKQRLKLTDEEVAYMGDDLPDLPILRKVGLSFTVPQAPQLIQDSVNYVTKKKGGKGAVREACEIIMQAQNTFDEVLKTYL